jgi:hypothetical protein
MSGDNNHESPHIPSLAEGVVEKNINDELENLSVAIEFLLRCKAKREQCEPCVGVAGRAWERIETLRKLVVTARSDRAKSAKPQCVVCGPTFIGKCPHE